MPGNLQILNVVVIALQYSLVILLYYFLYRVVKIAIRDMANLTFNRKSEDLPGRDRTPTDSEVSVVPRLIVLEDTQQLLSESVFIVKESLTIGRGQHNNMVIDSSFVSHEHACISKVKHNYLITDLHSTNGTIINGRQIEAETALAAGDNIQIGPVMLKFER